MAIETIKVPDLGGADDVEVIEVCVSVGDQIEKEDSLLVLESDKASMEVPSPQSGKVSAIKVSEGDTVNEGQVIIELETGGSAGEEEQNDSSSAKGTTDEDDKEDKEDKSTEESGKKDETTSKDEKSGQSEQQENVPQNQSAESKQVNVPDIGTDEAVDVIEVCVAAGDIIEEGDSLVVLESDKASMEVPSPFSGKVKAVTVSEGDAVKEGDALLEMEISSAASGESTKPVSGSEASTETSSASASNREEKTVSPAPADEAKQHATEPKQVSEGFHAVEGMTANRPSGEVYAGPAVRKMAREIGLDLAIVPGSGPKGRIQKSDVKAFIKGALKNKTSAIQATSGSGIPSVPEIDFSQYGEVSIEPMSKLHKLTAANMHRSWLNVPHVTQFDEIDITDLEDFRKNLKAEAEKEGVRVTPLPFLLKACAAALKANPAFNASLHADGQSIVYKKYVHIGIAVDTPAGLMVPVVKDVDKKTIFELAAETVELAEKARDRKLKPQEMQGGCFTISSLGGMGGTGFTPIVNTPEVGILGVSKLDIKPRWNGQEFEPRKMLPVSLSYDHRAVNGADAGKFMVFLNNVLSDIRRLAL